MKAGRGGRGVLRPHSQGWGLGRELAVLKALPKQPGLCLAWGLLCGILAAHRQGGELGALGASKCPLLGLRVGEWEKAGGWGPPAVLRQKTLFGGEGC